ncbi:RNA-dependent ATPase rok1 [Coniosporium apollinis]|uniref:ATP-dependent RNA helicase n=1 Tax=Coniosporium apollinis TaxID=61459 RepID=A0ABQ9P4E8_9PEZI|nr:RNA-dependent ATPase rok1 [Coniosporium apollinis]
MDIFKLLSRSTKLSKSSSKGAPQAQLPSGGQNANPQLFGHDTSEDAQLPELKGNSGSRKRKRGQDRLVQAVSLPAELDFFDDAKHTGDNVHGDKPPREHGPEEEMEGGTTDRQLAPRLKEAIVVNGSAPFLSEEECRQILRSHKIKITALSDPQQQEEEAPAKQNGKKRRKAKEQPIEVAKKRKKIELYPQPLTSFSQLRDKYGISKRLAENIEAQGYTVPTEVQLGSLPLLLEPAKAWAAAQQESQGDTQGDNNSKSHGVDLLAIAPTGSGKTIAFLIPVINALLRDRNQDGHGEPAGPGAIIVAPTKELASQIANEGRKLSSTTGIRIALMRKGMNVVPSSSEYKELSEHERDEIDDKSDISDAAAESSQRAGRAREQGHMMKADVLVTTPLTLLNALKTSDDMVKLLPSVRYLVLDEADVLLDPLFRDQTMSIWQACSHPQLRVSLWSATMGSNVEQLAKSTIESHRAKRLGPLKGTPQSPLLRLVVGLKDSAVPNISHKLTYAATEQGKLMALRQLLHPTTSTDSSGPSLRPPFLIFTQTIPRANALYSELLYDIPPEAGGSSRIAVLHADLSDTARDRVMTAFRKGEVWVLITTDLLARGVDFRGINGVVNYDVPNSAAAYVHRVGRTGRAGREGGVAVTLYTEEDIPHVRIIAQVIAAAEKLRDKAGESGVNGAGVQQWLLDSLPQPSKRDRQRLKMRGVEIRRASVNGKEARKAKISTKSGFERKVENRRRGAMVRSQSRKIGGPVDGAPNKRRVAVEDDEFEGFGD